MENASKALIIAGAILISILLISVGIMVMNSTDSVTGGVGKEMDAQEIQMFNSKFENYIGESVRGSSVRTLLTTIDSNNATADDDRQVKVSGLGESTDAIATQIKSTAKYKVEKVTTKGIITEIKISNASTTTE